MRTSDPTPQEEALRAIAQVRQMRCHTYIQKDQVDHQTSNASLIAEMVEIIKALLDEHSECLGCASADAALSLLAKLADGGLTGKEPKP